MNFKQEVTITVNGLPTRVYSYEEKYGFGCAMCCSGDRCDEDCTAVYKNNKHCPHCQKQRYIKLESVELTTLEEIEFYLNTVYSESSLASEIDEAKGDYLNEDWQDEFVDEAEAYLETGRGEAENQVRVTIETHILTKIFGKDDPRPHDSYSNKFGEAIWETIQRVYPIFDA